MGTLQDIGKSITTSKLSSKMRYYGLINPFHVCYHDDGWFEDIND